MARPSVQSVFLRLLVRSMRRVTTDELNIEQRRHQLEELSRLARPALGVRQQPTTIAGMQAEWHTPVRATTGVVLYLHGGAYLMGSTVTHRAMVGRIARAARMRTLVFNYRLAPEHPFPAAIDDAHNAYLHLLQSGIPADQICLAGDSAGGGLALALMLTLREAGEPLPRCAALISPWVDLASTGDSMISRAAADPWLTPIGSPVSRHYLNGHDPFDPLASPLYANLEGLPPLLIQVGDHEILLSDSTRLAERAQAAGVDVTLEVYPAMWHVWHSFAPLLPEANNAIRQIGNYVQAIPRSVLV